MIRDKEKGTITPPADLEGGTCLSNDWTTQDNGKMRSSGAVPHTLLTDTNRGLPRPLVVLQANPHRGAHEPEPGVALVDHCVPVAEAVAADVAIHNGVWRATMTR